MLPAPALPLITVKLPASCAPVHCAEAGRAEACQTPARASPAAAAARATSLTAVLRHTVPAASQPPSARPDATQLASAAADDEAMRLVGLHRVPSGSVLARDVHTGRHGLAPLLVHGVVLDERKLAALERAGINAVYIDDALGRGIDVPQALSDETREQATKALATAFERVRGGEGADGGESGVPADTIGELREVACLIAEEIASCGDAIFALQDLAVADSYTLQHSIDVTALGLLVARRMFRERGWVDYRHERRYDRLDDRLVQIGLGLILHDIGKLIVPSEILNKPGALNEDEWALMKRHPVAGFDMLSGA